MYGISKITSQAEHHAHHLPGAEYSAANLAEHLNVFAREGVVLDMTAEHSPRCQRGLQFHGQLQ